MSNDYTPTTGEVRNEWAASRADSYALAMDHADAIAEAEFDRWLASVESAAAEKALEEAARQMPFPADPYAGFDYESLRAAFVQGTNWLRARAEAYRQEREEQ